MKKLEATINEQKQKTLFLYTCMCILSIYLTCSYALRVTYTEMFFNCIEKISKTKTKKSPKYFDV